MNLALICFTVSEKRGLTDGQMTNHSYTRDQCLHEGPYRQRSAECTYNLLTALSSSLLYFLFSVTKKKNHKCRRRVRLYRICVTYMSKTVFQENRRYFACHFEKKVLNWHYKVKSTYVLTVSRGYKFHTFQILSTCTE